MDSSMEVRLRGVMPMRFEASKTGSPAFRGVVKRFLPEPPFKKFYIPPAFGLPWPGSRSAGGI